jgi:hypothetical protein
MRSRSLLASAVAVAVAVVPLAASPASAAAAPVATGLVGPLSFSVENGTFVVAQSFAGKLTRFSAGGKSKDLVVRNPEIEIGAVETRGPGLLFAFTGMTKAKKPFARLVHRAPDGTLTTRGNLQAFEKNKNPDSDQSYGFQNVSKNCASKLPKGRGIKKYKGTVESHPFATTLLPGGDAVVADAAGNDIVRVTPNGKVSVIAVLPPQPLVVTKAAAKAQKLPGCVVGKTFNFEPVPTDVERHKGQLYVTTLPGGPEDPSLGARGSVYRINPDNGNWTRIGRGFLGATGLAVAKSGKVYVAELFGNRVSTIQNLRQKKVATVKQPSALEIADGKLYSTKDSLSETGAASIVRVPRG